MGWWSQSPELCVLEGIPGRTFRKEKSLFTAHVSDYTYCPLELEVEVFSLYFLGQELLIIVGVIFSCACYPL